MSKNIDKNIRRMIKAYIIPRIVSIYGNLQTYIRMLLNRRIVFKGAASGETNFIQLTDSKELKIPLTIQNNSHTHTSDHIVGSVKPDPDTIVKRDSSGNIIGKGSTHGDTGFKLSNGNDVSSLFMKSDYRPITVSTVTTGSGNYTNSIVFSMDGNNKITLNYNKANFCPVSKHPDVQKDGC